MTLHFSGAQAIIKVLGHQYRWLWPRNRTFLEVASMVVSWWILAFLCSNLQSWLLNHMIIKALWCFTIHYSTFHCIFSANVGFGFELELVLFYDTWVTARTFGVMYEHTLFCACKSPDQTSGHTRKMGHQPSNCRWSLNLPQGFVWVCMGQHMLSL